MLPRALGLGRDPVVAARLAARRASRAIGLGRVNGRRFAFNAGIGFDAELVRRIDERGRPADGRRPGDLAFARAARRDDRIPPRALRPVARDRRRRPCGVRPRRELRPVHVRRAARLCTSRRGASFDRGLELVAPTRVRARELPRLAFDAVARSAAARGARRAARRASGSCVRCDRPLPLQVDGEDLGDVDHAVFEAEPRGRRGARPRAGTSAGSAPRQRRASRAPKRSDQRRPIARANCVSSIRKCSSSTSSSASSSRRRIAVELAPVHVERLLVVGEPARVGVADRREPARDAAHRRLDRLVAAAPHERAVEHRVGPHHARPLAEVALEQVDRPLELGEVGRGRRPHRLVDDGALEHAPRAEDVDGRRLLELTAVKIATAGTRSVTTKMPPDFPRRTSTSPESSSTRSAWRSVGFEIPSCSASTPSFGSRSPVRSPARSTASVRCSIAASNVRVARTGLDLEAPVASRRSREPRWASFGTG